MNVSLQVPTSGAYTSKTMERMKDRKDNRGIPFQRLGSLGEGNASSESNVDVTSLLSKQSK